jgi:hypothetical protein
LKTAALVPEGISGVVQHPVVCSPIGYLVPVLAQMGIRVQICEETVVYTATRFPLETNTAVFSQSKILNSAFISGHASATSF